MRALILFALLFQSLASISPTLAPTKRPTRDPSNRPTPVPPTLRPTHIPTLHPTLRPTRSPTLRPTLRPTNPTRSPTNLPTRRPTNLPTFRPTRSPTTSRPTTPTRSPTRRPSIRPTTGQPSRTPTSAPSKRPTLSPTGMPSKKPTTATPTKSPTQFPTSKPSTGTPTRTPTTAQPTKSPTLFPTFRPTTLQPTLRPTTARPTKSPTQSPTPKPTNSPTSAPSKRPTLSPTLIPTRSPTNLPTKKPTVSPTQAPSKAPTKSPTIRPTTDDPTRRPTPPTTQQPTRSPTAPTTSPTNRPTTRPTLAPTKAPTTSPTSYPTLGPTLSPSLAPSKRPTFQPTFVPTYSPTNFPTPRGTPPTTKRPTLPPSTRSPSLAPTPLGVPTKSPSNSSHAPTQSTPIVTPPTRAPTKPTRDVTFSMTITFRNGLFPPVDGEVEDALCETASRLAGINETDVSCALALQAGFVYRFTMVGSFETQNLTAKAFFNDSALTEALTEANGGKRVQESEFVVLIVEPSPNPLPFDVQNQALLITVGILLGVCLLLCSGCGVASRRFRKNEIYGRAFGKNDPKAVEMSGSKQRSPRHRAAGSSGIPFAGPPSSSTSVPKHQTPLDSATTTPRLSLDSTQPPPAAGATDRDSEVMAPPGRPASDSLSDDDERTDRSALPAAVPPSESFSRLPSLPENRPAPPPDRPFEPLSKSVLRSHAPLSLAPRRPKEFQQLEDDDEPLPPPSEGPFREGISYVFSPASPASPSSPSTLQPPTAQSRPRILSSSSSSSNTNFKYSLSGSASPSRKIESDVSPDDVPVPRADYDDVTLSRGPFVYSPSAAASLSKNKDSSPILNKAHNRTSSAEPSSTQFRAPFSLSSSSAASASSPALAPSSSFRRSLRSVEPQTETSPETAGADIHTLTGQSAGFGTTYSSNPLFRHHQVLTPVPKGT